MWNQQFPGIAGFECGAPRLDVMPLNAVPEQISGNILAAKLFRQSIASIDNSTHGDVPTREILVGNMFEVAKGVWIMQGAMFPKAFPIIATLYRMQHSVLAEIGGINQLSLIIEIQSPRVSTSFAEQFKSTRDRMISPDTLLKFNAANLRCDGAALASIKPAVWSPRQ